MAASPQSPLGYPSSRDDATDSEPDEFLASWTWAHEVANDLAWLLDTRGQHKASWASLAGEEITVVGADLDSKQGSDVFSWVETIGPFPVWRRPDGKPEALRVVLTISSSAGTTHTVFCRAVLRMATEDFLMPDVDNPGLRAGYTIDEVQTDSSTPIAKVLTTSPDSFLRFDSARIGGGYMYAESAASDYQPQEVVLCCIDLYMGRLSASTNAKLHGYIVRASHVHGW